MRLTVIWTTLSALAVATSCGGDASQVSNCGLHVVTSRHAPQLADYNAWEARMVQHGIVTCERLEDVWLYTRDTAEWQDSAARQVAGTSSCGYRLKPHWTGAIQIGAQPHLRLTALAHEAFHIGHCDWLTEDPAQDHAGWDTRIVPETGISVYDTIALVNAP